MRWSNDMDDEGIRAAGDRLTTVLRTAQTNIRNVRSFMRVMDIGLNASGPELYPYQEETMRQLVAENRWNPPDTLVKMAAAKAVEMRLTDAASAAEAAILLFGHSVLDAATTELCAIIAEVAPDLWEDALSDRRVRLKDLKEQGSYHEALRQVLKAHIAEVERKSLTDRIRLINVKSFPGDAPLPTFESMWGGDFRVDLDRIKQIDDVGTPSFIEPSLRPGTMTLKTISNTAS
jgi:hypothetical protein